MFSFSYLYEVLKQTIARGCSRHITSENGNRPGTHVTSPLVASPIPQYMSLASCFYTRISGGDGERPVRDAVQAVFQQDALAGDAGRDDSCYAAGPV